MRNAGSKMKSQLPFSRIYYLSTKCLLSHTLTTNVIKIDDSENRSTDTAVCHLKIWQIVAPSPPSHLARCRFTAYWGQFTELGYIWTQVCQSIIIDQNSLNSDYDSSGFGWEKNVISLRLKNANCDNIVKIIDENRIE